MADIDTDPFSDHNKRDSHLDETDEKIPLTPGGAIGGSTWESEHHLEEKVKELNSLKNALKGCIKCYLKA